MGAPGCDDAPIISVPRGPTARYLTLVYPYYENPAFFAQQLRHWGGLPRQLRDQLRIIVVDDGSPERPAAPVLAAYDGEPLNVRLFRIEVDVRWNWLAARNIGAHHASDGWVLLTDMDHIVPADTLEHVVWARLEPSTIYRFQRREHDGRKIHPHPNSWLMLRSMYWKVGGYDEALSGLYGTDGDYRRRCAATAPIRILINELERHEYQGDSSTTLYKRKQPEDAGKKTIIQARRKAKGWRPKTLSFPYHQVI